MPDYKVKTARVAAVIQLPVQPAVDSPQQAQPAPAPRKAALEAIDDLAATLNAKPRPRAKNERDAGDKNVLSAFF